MITWMSTVLEISLECNRLFSNKNFKNNKRVNYFQITVDYPNLLNHFWPLSPLSLCPAWFCAPRTFATHSPRPHPEDQGCSAWAGQSAVPQDEEDPLPGEAQWAHGRKPRRGRGGWGTQELMWKIRRTLFSAQKKKKKIQKWSMIEFRLFFCSHPFQMSFNPH